MGKGVPKMYDPSWYVQAGINPDTGLPRKYGCGSSLKDGIKSALEKVDRQNAINCFTWYNLPSGITPELIERILYYRGTGGMFFYMREVDKFLFLPYALDGEIDVYGRFNTVTPLPFNGTASANKDGKEQPWITGLLRDVVYEAEIPDDYISETGEILVDKILKTQDTKCVLLKDYTEGFSQYNEPRYNLQQPILDVMSDLIPFARTALLNGTGVNGMRINDQSEANNVILASEAVNSAALNGEKWVPITYNLELQELTSGSTVKPEEYFLALQSLDNFRLSLYGLDNGGLFQKQSHMLEAEQEVNQGNVGLILRDRLTKRQQFCTIVNSIWDLNMWCEVSETVIGVDRDGDGTMGSNEDQQSNAQNTEGGTSENENSN